MFSPVVTFSTLMSVGGVALAAASTDLVVSGAAMITIVAGIAGAVYGTKRKTELVAARGEAEAWRGERDAAVAKADRIEAENRRLVEEVAHLREQTNLSSIVETLQAVAARASEEHGQIVVALKGIETSLIQNTEAVKFLAAQVVIGDKPLGGEQP